jgi:Flp pilus assembly protein TadB
MMRDISRRQRELGRFQGRGIHWWNFFVNDLRRYAAYRTPIRTLSTVQSALADRDARRLEEAGMSHGLMKSRYFLLREVLLMGALVTSVYFFASYGAHVAAFLMPPIAIVAVWGPRLWLHLRWLNWQRRLDTEQLFLLEMVHVGASQGWDSIRILHELADVLKDERTASPIATELRRAQWRARMGGTFEEGLRAIPTRMKHKGSVKKMEALADSLKVNPTGGHDTIAALSREAYHEYIMELERRGSVTSMVLASAACLMVIGFVFCLQVPFTG